ncbi:MAG: FAD-dependent oxidoreductase [Sutterellaceae bacterium]|nr:FAD-dependent oxidoreductase [Sutterellaceae bacterium]MDY2868579.1 FAD-dependent oxidoreductase [Mesosutterella sp.]
MKPKTSRLRVLTAAAFLLLTALGLAFHTGWGTLSSFGIGEIASICPLGALETLAAGHSIALRGLCALVVFIIFTILLGRVFCGWMCPVPLVRRPFGKKNRAKADPQERPVFVKPYVPKAAADGSRAAGAAKGTTSSPDALPSSRSKNSDVVSQTPFWVLGGAIASSAVFGFPVFCLICPVGITFAIVIGAWRLFAFADPAWSLLFFAAVLAVELVFFRRWCHTFCPLGAVISLVARLNRTFRPRVDKSACLKASKGLPCRACAEACPEGINLTAPLDTATLSRCTKCHECSDACPAGAISFPFSLGSKASAGARTMPGRVAAKFVPAEERKNSFTEAELPVSDADAAREASRCISCRECVTSCPLGNPIPEWLREVREGRLKKAAELLMTPGTMPEVTSRICPKERLCEGHCSMEGAGGGISVGSLERLVADTAFRKGWIPRPRGGATGLRAAVIGAGPSGLAFADTLACAGAHVTVYDRNPEIGGLLTYGIPAFKLPREIVKQRRALYERRGIRFELGKEVGKDVSLEALLSSFDAVYAAPGAWRPIALAVPGAGSNGVLQALPFLSEHPDVKGKAVLVLGGGDTAVDCARTAVRLGASSVTIAYRRGEERMRAEKSEVILAREEGVRFRFNSDPGEVLSENGTASGVRFKDGSTEPAAAIVVAFGFTGTASDWLRAPGIEFGPKGEVSAPAGQTGNPKILAGGDAVRGPALAVYAIADGRAAALSLLSRRKSSGKK